MRDLASYQFRNSKLKMYMDIYIHFCMGMYTCTYVRTVRLYTEFLITDQNFVYHQIFRK